MSEIRYQSTTAVTLEPEARMTAPVAQVLSRAAKVLGSPTVTPDPVSTTVTAAASPTSVTFASGVGVAPGQRYLFISPEWSAISRVRSAVGTAVHLSDALPGTPATGTTVQGLDLTLTLSGAMTATVSEANLIVVTDAPSGAQCTKVYDVARYPFRGPVTASDVLDYLTTHHKGSERTTDVVWQAKVAQVCNDRLRARLRGAARYLHRFWDPNSMREPGLMVLRLAMAEDHGLYATRIQDPNEYLRSLRFELTDRITNLLLSTEPYDSNGDGTIDDAEVQGIFSITVGRG